MSKREKSREASLPLFDLPLHGTSDGPELPPPAEEGEPAAPQAPMPHAPMPQAPGPQAPAPNPAPVAPGLEGASQPLLFSPEELEGGGGGEASSEEDFDDGPTVQDRLLGGLADVTAVLAVVGLSIVAAQLLGVRVGLASWPPFVVFGLLFSFPYAVIPLAFWGHTPGMAWAGQTARSLDDEPLSFGQTTQRWLGAILTVAGVGLPLLFALGGGGSIADRLSASKTVHLP